MVTTLSQLVDMTQGAAIPAWLRSQILERKTEIANALNENREIILTGPNGEEITIQAERKVAAASF